MRRLATIAFAFAIVVACGGSLDGPSADLVACAAAGECDIRPRSCCGSCAAPTPTDMIGINWQKGSEYGKSVCGPTNGCPACLQEPDPNLAPVCRAKECKAIDVRVDDASSGCKVDQDCRLRFPGCCEACGSPTPDHLIALSNGGAAEYVANQCKPDAGGCPKCAIMYPVGYEAICNPATLHCEVGKVFGLDGGGGG